MNVLSTYIIGKMDPNISATGSRKSRPRRGYNKCLGPYGGMIAALAENFTASEEEADAAALEIFLDISAFGEFGGEKHNAEGLLNSLVARRRLLNSLR